MIRILLLTSLLFAGVTASADNYQLRAVAVIDGDTIKADICLGLGVALTTQSIRLAGIDTPEVHKASYEESMAGIDVKKWLTFRVIDGKTFEIKNATRDKYGRVMGDLYIDNVNVCTELLLKGFAREYKGEAKTPWMPEALQKIKDDIKKWEESRNQ